MPSFDGTGPASEGTMTGYGRGYCILPLEQRDFFSPYYATRPGFRGYRRFGRGSCGRGLGFGFRRGPGRGPGFALKREHARRDDEVENNSE